MTKEITQIFVDALINEGIKNIESDDSSIFFRMEGKMYLVTIREQIPPSISVRSFNPQPKPERKKK